MSQDHHFRRRPAVIFRPLFALFDGISGRDRQKARSLRAKLDEARQEAAGLLELEKKESARLRRELKQQRSDNKVLGKANDRFTRQLELVRKQEQRLRAEGDRLQLDQTQLKKDLAQRSQETQMLQQTLDQLREEQTQLSQCNSELQQEVETLRQTNQGLRHSETQLQKTLAKSQRRASQFQQQLQQEEAQHQEARQEIQGARQEIQAARQEIEEYETWIQRVETENAELGSRCEVLEQESDRIEANLENTFTQLKAFNDRLHRESPETWQTFSGLWKSLDLETLLPIVEDAVDDLPDIGSLDLSGWRLALVGGHDSTRRGVTEALGRYGIHNIIEVPPADQKKIDQGRVKEKVDRCDLIIVITGYLSHKMTKILHNLYQQNALAGELLYLNCRGCSGVVRDVVAYVQAQDGNQDRTQAS